MEPIGLVLPLLSALTLAVFSGAPIPLPLNALAT
jgi:hypothetical protein